MLRPRWRSHLGPKTPNLTKGSIRWETPSSTFRCHACPAAPAVSEPRKRRCRLEGVSAAHCRERDVTHGGVIRLVTSSDLGARTESQLAAGLCRRDHQRPAGKVRWLRTV